MPRFPIKQEKIKDNQVNISGSDYRHIVKVLRLKTGSEITLFDESSVEHFGRITEIKTKEIKVVIIGTKYVERESKLNITLLQGIPKGEKMDFIVEKATELGVKNIAPVITARSHVIHTQKIKRWKWIALESSKQCGRFAPPHINEALNFDQAINYNYNSMLKIILYEKCQDNFKTKFSNYLQPIHNMIIFVGPEGGFSKDEVKFAGDKGFISMGLGPRILRTETAGIVAISILQFLYGDI
ncbi:MAG: 16S rRNA (uracil(1498)-N(3))-methyltransferase [Deltaproteobacteria bacterium]|nr:16S rRNA (uracil(1498)-N(3))-methyltransferase [Deltaproteobacteria bacterium]